ncbi:MAG: tetratricopeptide repeat protein [Planctomycetaceae bacterium]|nr:tetratricopeptide repeat protein [Planctomycetaceae bacterium]
MMARTHHPSFAARCGTDCARSVLILMLLTVDVGCARMRSQLSRRSSECTQLCEEARLAREQGRQAQADELLDAAVRQRPKDTETQLQLIDELWTSGRQLAAAESLQRIVTERPDDAPLALRLAQMEFDIGRTEAAQSALLSVLRNDPENPEAIRLKGKLEEQRGDTAAALATYHHLLQVTPEDFDAQLRLAHLHLKRGQPDRAAPLLRAALDHTGATKAQRIDAEWQLGLAYAQMERWADSADALQSAIGSRRATAEDWYRLAYAQSQVGNQEAAFDSLSQALTAEPTHLAARDLARQIKLDTGTSPSSVLPAGFQPRTGQQTALLPP